jgi:hypothetical protein
MQVCIIGGALYSRRKRAHTHAQTHTHCGAFVPAVNPPLCLVLAPSRIPFLSLPRARCGAQANLATYNLAAITSSLVASKATCCAGRSLSVTLQGSRVVELLVSAVEPFDHTCMVPSTVLSLAPAE